MPEQKREGLLSPTEKSSDEFVRSQVDRIRQEIDGVSVRTEAEVIEGELFPPRSIIDVAKIADKKEEGSSETFLRSNSPIDSGFALSILKKRNTKRAA